MRSRTDDAEPRVPLGQLAMSHHEHIASQLWGLDCQLSRPSTVGGLLRMPDGPLYGLKLGAILQRRDENALCGLRMDGYPLAFATILGHSPGVSAPIHPAHPGATRNSPVFPRTIVYR